MTKRLGLQMGIIGSLLFLVLALVFQPAPVLAAGVTTSLHLVKYDSDGVTILTEKTIDYRWMEQNLEIYGDGKTHYYHQGPVFEGDPWDPDEVINLKDKGALKGTAVQDLCDQIGGMAAEDELMLVSIDKWHTEFAYSNVYTPVDAQGVIAICWYNGAGAMEGEGSGTGYPANNGFNAALQMVFMSAQSNREGKHVFGNNDMRIALPQEEYQHFFEGQYPSTNGLSGKWIAELRIYKGGTPENVTIEWADDSHPQPPEKTIPWLPVILGLAGVALVVSYFYMRRNKP